MTAADTPKPRKSEVRQRQLLLGARVNEAEMQAIQQAAERHQISVSSYVRRLVLDDARTA